MKVVVVGSGLAGLTAAVRLREAGVDVGVVEAAKRIGGRLLRQQVAGVPVDGGGAWVGPTQDRVLALIDELGLTTSQTYDAGKHLVRLDGRVRARAGRIPAVPIRALPELVLMRRRLDRLARRLPEDPTAEPARSLDRQSVADWADRRLRTSAARTLLTIAVGANFGCRLEHISLLALATSVRGAGGFAQLTEVRGGAQDARIVGGALTLCERLASRLPGGVRLGSPVQRVRQGAEGVGIDLAGDTLEADRAIVAVDPARSRAIDFDGHLDPSRQRLHERYAMGTGIKFHIAYQRPFWRQRGFSGQLLADEGLVRIAFDCTPPQGAPGILVGFLGEAADCDPELLAPGGGERRAAEVAQAVEAAFGAGGEPLDYVEQDWRAEPFLDGCVPAPPPGVLSAAGPAVAQPAGRVHFAGAERSDVWEGHMEGAVRSGERAATEVLGHATR